MLTNQENREFIRLRVLHDADLLEMWRCRKQGHSDCYTADHISEAAVLAEANSHATTCQCWQHSVLRELDRLRRIERRERERHERGPARGMR